MPLMDFYRASRDTVLNMSLEQVVAMAGDGKMRDDAESSRELREFFANASTAALEKYVNQCLSAKFNESGLVLQDLANELGRRLEYEVVNGAYQGTSNKIGYDGIWKYQSEISIVIEVKTTDAFRINLDTLAGYRTRLIESEEIPKQSSILLIVGRKDTGDIEAQIRGSRHAWDIRIISFDALIKLVKLKESADSNDTISKIRGLLTPFEYTRLDNIIDVMFTTTADVVSALEEDVEIEGESQVGPKKYAFTDSATINKLRSNMIEALSKHFSTTILSKSRALYWNPEKTIRFACTISKRYDKKNVIGWYWYAYHKKWDTFLSECAHSYIVLGCVDSERMYMLPRQILVENLEYLNYTAGEDGTPSHWHVTIDITDHASVMQRPKQGTPLDVAPYMMRL